MHFSSRNIVCHVESFWLVQPTHIRQNCICISFQLGAKGDVELRRGKNGGLVLPSKLIVGTQTLKDLVSGIVLKSKILMTHECII